MLCPGVYPPDPTLGITDPQMLPPPKLVPRSRNYAHRPCPECGKSCPRDRVRTRTLHDLGDPVRGRPRDIQLTYSLFSLKNRTSDQPVRSASVPPASSDNSRRRDSR